MPQIKTVHKLSEIVAGWKSLILRWPHKRWGMAEGCDMLDMHAFDILEREGIARVDWTMRTFGASDQVIRDLLDQH